MAFSGVLVRALAFLSLVTLVGCAPEYDVVGLVGQDGLLRFNLVFDNENAVDLDLHVRTPGGDEIYYAEPNGPDGGELDVDCLCGDCPNGPSENIFWAYDGVADPGTYEVSVVYYGPCDLFAYPYPASNYTLRVLEAGDVIEIYTGTLDDFGAEDGYEHTYGVTTEAE